MQIQKNNVIRAFQYRNKQSKLFYVAHGKILDIVINLNSKSKNFGKIYKFILKSGEMLLCLIFLLMVMNVYQLKCSVFYHLEKYSDVKNESGIMYNDSFKN